MASKLPSLAGEGQLTSEALNAIVADVLQRAPDWLRRDLCSSDTNVRRTAEDTLAIMISGAIAGG